MYFDFFVCVHQDEFKQDLTTSLFKITDKLKITLNHEPYMQIYVKAVGKGYAIIYKCILQTNNQLIMLIDRKPEHVF